MNFALKKLIAYCEAHSTPESPVLKELERETHLKTLAPQMLSGKLQGQFLRMLSLLLRPKYILEIGTFTGYATLSLADGIAEGGQLHTIEANEELAYIVKKYVEKAGMQDKVSLHIGDAKAIIPTLDISFDMVFIDAGKMDYSFYYDQIIDKVSPNGIILADNVLWSGKVVQKEHDNDTQVIHQFNEKVLNDDRVENIILPIRDGLMLARKK